MLETYLKNQLKKKKILLMTHIVMGYPDFDTSFEVIRQMAAAGVDIMELQIPFSEPIADGPVILRANQEALEKGATVRRCLEFAQTVSRSFHIPFLLMSYYNILFRYGVERFTAEAAERGIKGAIVPDLPPEEGAEYMAAMNDHQLAPIFIFSPTTPDGRMDHIASVARGFIYCVARKGTTGAKTDFSRNLTGYLNRCRRATSLPLALGFGVKEKKDIDFLTGKVDMAVIGSQMIRLIDQQGIETIQPFIRSLR